MGATEHCEMSDISTGISFSTLFNVVNSKTVKFEQKLLSLNPKMILKWDEFTDRGSNGIRQCHVLSFQN